MGSKVEIVKVQIPIIGGQPGCCLIYDRKRRHITEQPMPKDVLVALRGDLKGYFYARWFESQGWVVTNKRAGEQTW